MKILIHYDEDANVVKVNGRFARRRYITDGVRDIFMTSKVVVKIGAERQNRREAKALRSAAVQREAKRLGIVLPRLLAVDQKFGWIAVQRLPLRRPRRGSARQSKNYDRVDRFMRFAERDDHNYDYWNWAMVGKRPCVYDLGT